MAAIFPEADPENIRLQQEAQDNRFSPHRPDRPILPGRSIPPPRTSPPPISPPAPSLPPLYSQPSPIYGEVIFPIPGKTPANIGSPFGAPRDNGTRHHLGVDIGAPEGTPVVAAVSGTVVAVGTGGGGFGQRVNIADQHGNIHSYAHLSSFGPGITPTSAGSRYVLAGEVIGYVGSTGNADSKWPHLHYSINEADNNPNNSIDPEDFFATGQLRTIDPSYLSTSPTGDSNPGGESNMIADPRENITPEEALDIIFTQFPHFIAFAEIPELREIFSQAVAQGWGPGRLQASLEQTEWWKSRNEDQRRFEALRASDPGTFQQIWTSVGEAIIDQYQQLGLDVPEDEELSDTIEEVIFGFVDYDTGQIDARFFESIAREAPYDAEDPTPSGTIGDTMEQIRNFAGSYFVRLTDEDLFQLSTKVLAGDLTSEGVEDFIRDQARVRFAHDTATLNGIDNGFSPSQIFSSQRDQLAQVLGLDPQGISFYDPRFARIIDHVDDKGTRRAMTVDETFRYARSLPEARTTRQFHQDTANVMNGLLEAFGVR